MQTLDLAGIFAFAVSGALMAIRRDHDVVGIVVLAVVTSLGGGILRDLVLGDTPPPAFTRWEYLVVPLVAAALSLVAAPELERLGRGLLVFDAAGLGLFTVASLLCGVAQQPNGALSYDIKSLINFRTYRCRGDDVAEHGHHVE